MTSWIFLPVKLASLLISFILVGCQLTPTRVTQTQGLDYRELVEKTALPLELTDKTIVIDVRSFFDYKLSHLPQAQHLQWQDFSDPRAKNKGPLKNDLFRSARRLSTKGVGPQSEVIVVGTGLKGDGEEGRVAWTLMYMGVEKVQYADIKYFMKIPRSKELITRKNTTMWKPNIKTSLQATTKELRSIITQPKEHLRTYIIDVRSKKEYFNKATFGGNYEFPDINAIHIEWKQFLTQLGRPNTEIKKQIIQLGIGLNDRIIFISKQGLRSAAATAALYSLGFKNVANYSGGYRELFMQKQAL